MTQQTKSVRTIGSGALFSLLLIPTLSTVGVGALSPVLSQISDHFRDTPGADIVVRSLVTSLGGAMMVGASAAGFLAERFGERQILLWSLLLFAVFGMAGMFLDDPWTLLLSRVGVGLAIGAAGVMAITLISNGVSDDGRHRWLGFYSVAGTVGAVAVMPVAGLLGAISWRLIFPLHLLALPMLALCALLIGKTSKASRAAATQGKGSAFPIGMLMLGLACGMVISTVPAYLPFHFREFGEHRPDRIAAAITASVAAAGVVSLAYGWIRRHLGAADVFALGFLAMGLGLSVVAWGRSVESAVVGMSLSGIGIGLLGPNIFAVAANAEPERRARRVGMARAGFFGAPLLAQLPLEPVAITHGADGVLFVLAAFAMTMIVVVMLGRRSLAAAPAQHA